MISIDGKNFDSLVRTLLQEKAVKLIELKTLGQLKLEVKAPMPGMVLKIKKQPGDEVMQGDSVLILEAMKMENDLRAHKSGKIQSINVKEGMAVEKGYTLFIIE
jgi:biotin carboxyl carrier protein